MAVHYLGDNGPDGTTLGTGTTEKISFYGVTPVVQQTSSNFANAGSSIDVLPSSYLNGTAGLSSAGATAVLAVLNTLVDALHDVGLIDEA